MGLTLDNVALAGIFSLHEGKCRTEVGDRNGLVRTEDVAVVGFRLEEHRFGEVSARCGIDEEVEV